MELLPRPPRLELLRPLDWTPESFSPASFARVPSAAEPVHVPRPRTSEENGIDDLAAADSGGLTADSALERWSAAAVRRACRADRADRAVRLPRQAGPSTRRPGHA